MITFLTPGPLHIRALTTFGVSVKGESAIGRFGTGFKYASAIILREGGTLTARSGDEDFTFSTLPEEIRGEAFEVVTLNGQPLGFTTRTGRDWKMRDAFRELMSNTLDEGGRMELRAVEPPAGWSAIYVLHPDFTECAHKVNEIFLPNELTPVAKFDLGEVYDHTTYTVYFKGVAVGVSPAPLRFTYNILTGITLSEDRTAKYGWEVDMRLISLITQLPAAQFDSICNREGCGEHKLVFTGITRSEKLIANIERRIEKKLSVPQNFRQYFYKHALESAEKIEHVEVRLTKVEAAQLSRAISFCKSIGFELDRFPIHISDKMQPSIMGMARNEKIIINKAVFTRGIGEIAKTLIEEYIHLVDGVRDETRAMQEAMLSHILRLGQEASGEVV